MILWSQSLLRCVVFCLNRSLARWGKVTVSEALLRELLPGPVTVVFERLVALNPELNPGTTLVGIRVPDHGFVREVSRLCGEPLALTSANVSSHESTLSVQVWIWNEILIRIYLFKINVAVNFLFLRKINCRIVKDNELLPVLLLVMLKFKAQTFVQCLQ